MKNESFQFEIENLMAQFIAAMDDITVKRYNKDRVAQDKIQVRMVYSPKERVLLDLTDKAQNIQLPVIAISIGGISRDNSRVFNKLQGSTYRSSNPKIAGKMPQPIPVNVTVNFSILTRYQKDMDQIISNFTPYFDPYIVLSWRVPDMDDFEIRSQVEWSNNITFNYPQDIASGTVARVTGDTSFTIKGWLYKAIPDANAGNGEHLIFTINANFYALSAITGYDPNIPKDITYWESRSLTATPITQYVPALTVYNLSAISLSATNAHFFNNVYIDNNLYADLGFFYGLSSYSISATNFYGDGSGLTNITANIRKSVTVIGDNINTDYTITHGFSSLNTLSQVYNYVTGSLVYPSIQTIDSNNTLIHFNTPPTLSSYKVIIIT